MVPPPGASRIFATDINPPRLALAKKLGATAAFDVRQGDGFIKEIKSVTCGEGVDVLLEMSGTASAFDQGFRALRNGGTEAILEIPSKPITWNITEHVVFKGATVLGINGRTMFETWYQMEELLLSGRLELDEIITHEFRLEEFEKAFVTMMSGEGIKVVMGVGG